MKKQMGSYLGNKLMKPFKIEKKPYMRFAQLRTAVNFLLEVWSSPTEVVPRPYRKPQLNNMVFKQYCVPLS